MAGEGKSDAVPNEPRPPQGRVPPKPAPPGTGRVGPPAGQGIPPKDPNLPPTQRLATPGKPAPPTGQPARPPAPGGPPKPATGRPAQGAPPAGAKPAAPGPKPPAPAGRAPLPPPSTPAPAPLPAPPPPPVPPPLPTTVPGKELEVARMAVRRGYLTGRQVVEAQLAQAAGTFKRSLLELLGERGLAPDVRADLEAKQAARDLGLDQDELDPGLAAAPDPDPRVGKVVFSVRLDVRIERRPFVTSYAGRRAGDPEPVVLKLIETTALRGGLWLDFFETVRAAIAVKSPNVVPVLDAGRAEGAFAIVQRHVDGIDVAQLLQRVRRVRLSEALRIGLEAARGVRDLHRAGLVHRDVRPSVLRLAKKGDVLVQDAGLVFEPPGARRVIGAVGVYGTPHYLAPEVAQGSLGDAKSDVYSLGVCLYELITGSRPFEGLAFRELRHQILDEVPLPPHEHQPDIPPGVSDFLLAMLAKRREERPSSDDVVALIEKLSTEIPRTGTTMRLDPGKL